MRYAGRIRLPENAQHPSTKHQSRPAGRHTGTIPPARKASTMKLKKNLIAVSISAALLAACGG